MIQRLAGRRDNAARPNINSNWSAAVSEKGLPLPSYLRQRLRYEPDTGKLYWRACPMLQDNWIARWAGREAGTTNDRGYRIINLDGRLHRAHHVAWAMMTGEWPDEVDHENHDRVDNRWGNLRKVTRLGNRRNASRSRNNSSGVTGVTAWPDGRWRANIMVDRKNLYLGLFERFDDAVAARKAAEVKHGFHPNHGSG